MYQKEILFPGIWVFHDVITPQIDAINRMESILSSSLDPNVKWQDATVGYHQKLLDYRDCVDFKLAEFKSPQTEDQLKLGKLWNDLYTAQKQATDEYCAFHSLKMDYWEVMNFIKYGPGQHFKEHADHGFSYSATVSLVAYPNDDYVGGELFFPKIGLRVAPKAGDLYVFPSTYLFSHVAEPVKEGTKYSLVTMLDYNNHAHNQEFYEMRTRMVEAEGN
jgi:predicted 2-oxoglutarate/Fe(II)-dependent dioxygenase YbiX